MEEYFSFGDVAGNWDTSGLDIGFDTSWLDDVTQQLNLDDWSGLEWGDPGATVPNFGPAEWGDPGSMVPNFGPSEWTDPGATVPDFGGGAGGGFNPEGLLRPGAQVGAAAGGAAFGGSNGGAGSQIRPTAPGAGGGSAGGGAPGAPGGAGGGRPWWESLLSPAGIAGLIGAIVPAAGAIASGGETGSQRTTVTPRLSPEQLTAGYGAANAWAELAPFIHGQTPLQQQQMSLFNALASGEGLPQGYQQLIEQAYQPAMGDIATQAIESARRRGFAGGAGLLQEGPAGAIAGPALADLQGQMANSKLGLMQTLPGLYNTPIQTQGGFAAARGTGLTNIFAALPSGQRQEGTSSVPLGMQLGNMIGQGFNGMGQAFAQQQQQEDLKQRFPIQPQQGGMSYWRTDG